MAEQTKQQQKR